MALDIKELTEEQKVELYDAIYRERMEREVEEEERNLAEALEWVKQNPPGKTSESKIELEIRCDAMMDDDSIYWYNEIIKCEAKNTGDNLQYNAEDYVRDADLGLGKLPEPVSVNLDVCLGTPVVDIKAHYQKILDALNRVPEPVTLKISIVGQWNDGEPKYTVKVASDTELTEYRKKQIAKRVRMYLRQVCNPSHYLFKVHDDNDYIYDVMNQFNLSDWTSEEAINKAIS